MFTHIHFVYKISKIIDQHYQERTEKCPIMEATVITVRIFSRHLCGAPCGEEDFSPQYVWASGI